MEAHSKQKEHHIKYGDSQINLLQNKVHTPGKHPAKDRLHQTLIFLSPSLSLSLSLSLSHTHTHTHTNHASTL